MVRAFVLLEALLEGGRDAERPPRNEKLVRPHLAHADRVKRTARFRMRDRVAGAVLIWPASLLPARPVFR